ncbi:glycoside hydrolase family 2 TIM barrel-domain containing protein [Paenibacillus sp. GCM10023248]|uniref:glycosyl hydrolase 2 galactose-binding domain-containing protein n=1 Tax=unclassified Paenibacillus TaxID=185978 RepID=UPI00237834EC|nr:glycoside hydrolase family 2 TIM barrel-domain containing protein [Paenibacillus sp. MAHUQ-63]MDD9268249.1 glycoside hydrolase family 2 TIM barrel-domain containing protein [Paenibacillus sp. MAHUQ-63]
MTERHETLDPFAEIALREHPFAKEGMSVSQPAAYEKRWFAASQVAVPRQNTPSFEAELSAFRGQLAALRERYRPYLQNKVPPQELVRPQLELASFQFRYREEQDRSFARVLAGEGSWEQVRIPDFRGPTKEQGRWTGYYRTEFQFPKPAKGKRLFLVLQGVDYKAAVYMNHKCLGMHEGLFASFEFDWTEEWREHNELVVEVMNEYPMMGVDGTRLDGDKMYAATGPGWDDPQDGWHHCPSGGGIYQRVFVEERSELYLQDLFIRPVPEEQIFEAWIDIGNTTDGLMEHAELRLEVYARNFEGEGLRDISFDIPYAGPGVNNYRYKLAWSDFRTWELETPYLYTLRATILYKGERIDQKDRNFGMRSFRMDEQSNPKGKLYFNGKPIILRGANEMGHLQQCVMTGNREQLIDDILIAKLANLNFYRITQRPVQEEIYDYMDMLGMLNQCDLPAFGFIRRNQFSEAVRQSAEMERLVRSHPCVVLVSLINEPSRPAKRGKGHRHLFRDELEAFFTAARQAIYIENPDRVIKNADGDYDPPTETGLSDFHCYTMWYTNHALPFGELYQGHLPPLKTGWLTGCGEYGSEGLDHLAVMLERYPQAWLPDQPDDDWMPSRIIDAQTYSFHGDWFPEPSTLKDWIRASQHHQAQVTRLMTDAIRRRADLIVSSAIHLLIDAWPSGWMKALVGVDRIPKPAYFAYRSSLQPLRVNLRCDRWRAYAGEPIEVEAWVLNDSAQTYRNCQIRVTLRDDREDAASYEIAAQAEAISSAYAGTIRLMMPAVKKRCMIYIDAELADECGVVRNAERFEIEVFPGLERQSSPPGLVVLGDGAESVLSALGVESSHYKPGLPFRTIVISSIAAYESSRGDIERCIRSGARAVFLQDEGFRTEWTVCDCEVSETEMTELFVLAHQGNVTPGMETQPLDFAYCYNRDTNRIDPIAWSYVQLEGLEPLIYTYEKPSRAEPKHDGKKKRAVAGKKRAGSGEVVIVRLLLQGRIGFNPTIDHWLHAILQ